MSVPQELVNDNNHWCILCMCCYKIRRLSCDSHVTLLFSAVDVEHSHVRFLGNLVLNLWDCGG